MPLLRVISCKRRHGAQQLDDMERPASDLQTVDYSASRERPWGRVMAGLMPAAFASRAPQECPAATNDVRGLLGRSRRPPIRGHTSSVPRHGLLGVGSLKQLPKSLCQQFDGLPQGAELPNPDYRDGSVQVKRWGTQYFHGIDRMIPGNKASG